MMQSKERGLVLSVSLILGVIAVSILCSLYSGNATETANSPSGVTANNASSLKDIILSKVSEREKVSINNLKVVNTVTIKPENIYRAKVLDKKAGKIYGIDLDSNYKVMNKGDIDNILKNKRKSEFVGKLSKGLVKKMEEMKKNGESHINVKMWIKMDKNLPELPREILSAQEKDARLKEIRDFYANQKSTNAVVKKLESMGHQVLYRSQYTPLLSVRMPIDDVAKVETDTNIDSIYATDVMKPQLNISARAIHADTAWADPNYDRCPEEWLGVIPIVAVIEMYGIAGGKLKQHWAIPGPISYKCFGEDDPNCDDHDNPTVGGDIHATMIMGIIAADANIPTTPPTIIKGVAHNVCRPLLSICAPNEDWWPATEWALTHWATVINLSWGGNIESSMAADDYFFDAIAHYYHRTVIVAAGNDSPTVNPNNCSCEGGNSMVSSPGRGFNVITVGGFCDKNTIGWEDDTFWDCSSYLNPSSPHGDRQKPEVVAPAQQIFSTSIDNGWDALDGTSFAAPHVTGAAALLISKSPSLEAWPEEVAAILMASAIHDIVDDPNAINPFLHEKDGVGAIDIASAKNVIDNGLNSHHILNPEEDLPYEKYIDANQGENVRAVIRWSSHTIFNHEYNSGSYLGGCPRTGYKKSVKLIIVSH